MAHPKQYQNWFVLILATIVVASLWLYIGAKIDDPDVLTVETIKTFNLLIRAVTPMLAGVSFFFYGGVGNDESRTIQKDPVALAIVLCGVIIGTGCALSGGG